MGKLESDLGDPPEDLIGMDRRELSGLPGPAEEALPGPLKCGEFSEAIRAIL